MSKKRSLDEREGESAKKKAKVASPSAQQGKPELSKAWTRTNPVTGESGRLQRKDATYRKHLNRRKTHMSKKKTDKDKTKEKVKEKEEMKVDTTTEERDYADLTTRFDGHVAIVTGGGEGIGQAVALRLAKEGAIVYILDKKKWKDTEKLCAQNVLTPTQEIGEGMRCDVTDIKEVKKCVDEIIEKHGYIDVVINAAVLDDEEALDLEKIKPTDLEKVLNVNFKGALNVCQLVLPLMRSEIYGRIVNLVSWEGVHGNQGQTVNASASGALISATRAMSKEYANVGVTINCVLYAFVEAQVDTDNSAYLKSAAKTVPIGRAAELAEIAGTVAWAACEENSYTTGFVYDCTGGMA